MKATRIEYICFMCADMTARGGIHVQYRIQYIAALFEGHRAEGRRQRQKAIGRAQGNEHKRDDKETERSAAQPMENASGWRSAMAMTSSSGLRTPTTGERERRGWESVGMFGSVVQRGAHSRAGGKGVEWRVARGERQRRV
jgi:hypothetical protein